MVCLVSSNYPTVNGFEMESSLAILIAVLVILLLSFVVVFFDTVALLRRRRDTSVSTDVDGGAKLRSRRSPLPPIAPSSLPIFGHLSLLRPPAHRSLAALSAAHGPILRLSLGCRPTLLVSSLPLAEECFGSRTDIAFANRPSFLTAGRILGCDFTNMGWAPHGELWRQLRRFAAVEVFSAARLKASSSIRADETHSLIRSLAGDYQKLQKVDGSSFAEADLKEQLFGLSYNVVMRMVAGKRYFGSSSAAPAAAEDVEEAREFKEIMEESFLISGANNLMDFLPAREALRLVGVGAATERRLWRLRRRRDEFSGMIIEQHRAVANAAGKSGGGATAVSPPPEGGRKTETLVGDMLRLQAENPEAYTDDTIKGFILQLITAGIDTSSATMEWAMALLLNNPSAIDALRFELDGHTERERRLIDEQDVSGGALPYLNAVISEALRLCPVVPLLVPHQSSEDCVVGGFHVPRGTMLLVNAWAILRDPKLWDQPEAFRPERFLITGGGNGEGEEAVVATSRMLPFGLGRRRCPGEGMGLRTVALVVGALVQCFEWERVGEEKVDMTEGKGMTMPKATPLVAKYKPRKGMEKYL